MADQQPEYIDHEARRKADQALSEVEHAKETLHHHIRRVEIFETEMRSAMTSVADKISTGHEKLHDDVHQGLSKVHERMNTFVRTALFALLSVAGSAVVGVILYLLNAKGVG